MAEHYFWTPDVVGNLTFAQVYWLINKPITVSVPPGGSMADAVRLAKGMR